MEIKNIKEDLVILVGTILTLLFLVFDPCNFTWDRKFCLLIWIFCLSFLSLDSILSEWKTQIKRKENKRVREMLKENDQG